MREPLLKAEINLSSISHNVRALKSLAGRGVKFMPAVKGDGYGHGAVKIAETALKNGADALGVARLGEALKLREAGIGADILLFGYSPPDHVKELLDYSLATAVSCSANASLISERALSGGKKVKVHLKVDSGMGRMGFPLPLNPRGREDFMPALNFVRECFALKGLNVEGLMTHFATADHFDKTFAEKQLEIFSYFIEILETEKIDIEIKHAANSAALIEMPGSHFNMVRPGISVYGLYPSAEVDRSLVSLRPAMKLSAKIINLKKVQAGCSISYGRTFITDRPTLIATLPIGYGDGFSRRFSSNGNVLVRGVKAPIVGRVCMDLTMIDVGHISGVSLEDEAVIFGQQGNEYIHADELAENTKTINYEIVTSLTSRVTRTYI